MEKECKKSEWDIRLKSKKKPSFKAGSELADKVNIMHVDINEETDGNSETVDVSLILENEKDNQIEFALKKKTRFKAGADLTEKVNVMHVDFIEETTEDSILETVKMKLHNNENELLALAVKKKRKTRFKAGADLTDKVNLIAVDWIEEITDETEEFTFSIKLKSSICMTEETIESKIVA